MIRFVHIISILSVPCTDMLRHIMRRLACDDDALAAGRLRQLIIGRNAKNRYLW